MEAEDDAAFDALELADDDADEAAELAAEEAADEAALAAAEAACEAACATVFVTVCCTAVFVTGHGVENISLIHLVTVPEAKSAYVNVLDLFLISTTTPG